ncbi:MAG: hypothetical protein WCK96_14380 [Methylococcales bacterium]
MTDKIQEQMDATADHGEQFRTELISGLDNMGDKVAKIAGGQGDTMTGMLEQLIEKFSGTISGAFNEQMQGIGGMINQAAASMQTTQVGFDGLIKDLRDTGAQERQAANEQMLKLMTAMDNRQETSQAQMQGFIEAINTQISNAQQNNAEQIRDSLNTIQSSTREILADIKQDRINARAEEQQQQQLFSDAMSSTFTEQMKKMGSMFMHTSKTMQTMQGGFETLMTDLRETGTQERQAVNSEIQELVTLMGQQQVALQSQMTDFITAINTQISSAQQDSSNQIRDSLSEIQSSTRQILADMNKERNAAIAVEQERQQQFANTISNTFTQQVDNVGGMLEKTATVMQTMQGEFNDLMQNLRDTGTQERQAVNSEIQELVTLMGQQQVMLQSQMESFISAINTQISNAQQDNSNQIRDSLIEIQSSTRQILADMNKERAAAIALEQQRQQQFANTVSNTFTQQVDNVGGMLEQTSTAMQTMQGGFETLMTDLRETGTQERQAVNSEIQDLVKLIGQQQVTLQSQMESFISAINTQISNAQQDNSKQIRESLIEIQSSTRQILANMDKERNAAIALEQQRQQQFANTVSDTFTQQVDNVGGMLEQTSTAIQTMQGGFETLMTDLRETGEQERKAVSAEMSALVKELENRQAAAQTNISDFVNSIATKHQDTLKITQENLTELQASTRKILADMEQERAALLQAERDRQQAFVDSSTALISKMESQISALVTQISNTMSALKDNTIELNNAGDKMTAGAEQISQASTDFAAAGNKVSSVLEQTEKLSTQLMTTGDQMSSAADTLKTQLNEYTATRELLGQMINEMENLLNRAKQEAGVNQQIVDNMQKMVSSFGVLKDDMDDFVTQVGGLLAETLAKFQNDMATHNTEFHKHHADTLTKVANAYQPLSASISGLIDMFAKTNNRSV